MRNILKILPIRYSQMNVVSMRWLDDVSNGRYPGVFMRYSLLFLIQKSFPFLVKNNFSFYEIGGIALYQKNDCNHLI